MSQSKLSLGLITSLVISRRQRFFKNVFLPPAEKGRKREGVCFKRSIRKIEDDLEQDTELYIIYMIYKLYNCTVEDFVKTSKYL